MHKCITYTCDYVVSRFAVSYKTLIITIQCNSSYTLLFVYILSEELPILLIVHASLQARAARKHFSSVDGDHITLVNVFRSSLEFLDKLKLTTNKEKSIKKNLSKWCKENFINNRSLMHARDVHR